MTRENPFKLLGRMHREAGPHVPAAEFRARRDAPDPDPPAGGPGTELSLLLKRIGIHAGPACRCTVHAATMDRQGPAWCRANLPTILTWLAEEAHNLGIPFNRLAATALIRLAIRRAERRNGL